MTTDRLQALLTDLCKNRLNIREYEELIQRGAVVRKPDYVDDSSFERDHPNHTLAASSRFLRIHAADELRETALNTPEKFDLRLLEELHGSAADCCAAVRLSVVRAIGYLRNPISIPVLEQVVEQEVPSSSVREAAQQGIGVIRGNWADALSADHNWFEDWMLNKDPQSKSWNEVEEHFKLEDRIRRAYAHHELLGRSVLLECSESTGMVAVCPDSDTSISLTAGEASAWLNTRRGNLSRRLQTVGLSIEEQDAEFGLANSDLIEEFPSSVLLDTTTVQNAELCLSGMVTPVCLLDLSILCTALICYEKVIVQPTHSRIVTDHAAAFAQLAYSRKTIVDTLWSTCAEILNSNAPNSVSNRAFEDAWKQVLKRDEIRINLQATTHHQNSPYEWDGIPAGYYAGSLFSRGRVDVQKMNEFLSVQTMRTLFNDALSGILAVPYLSSSIRAPVTGVLMNRKLQLQPIVDALIDELAPPASADDCKSASYAIELQAPFFLGLVLQESQRPEEILSRIMEYRRRAEPLRKQLAADREAWSGRGGAYVEALVKSMRGFTENQSKVSNTAVETTATAFTTLVTATEPFMQLAGLGIKLLLLLRPVDRVRKLYNRVFKPHIYLLTELSEEAAALRNVESQLKRVFGHAWTAESRQCLSVLASSYPASFAKLRHPRR